MNHVARLAELYLELMERVLLGVIYEDPPIDRWSGGVFNSVLRAKGRDGTGAFWRVPAEPTAIDKSAPTISVVEQPRPTTTARA